MNTSNRYWLYGGTQHPDGQAGHQLLGQFPTVASAAAAACEWVSQWRDSAGKWWHVVDIRRDKIVAQSEGKS